MTSDGQMEIAEDGEAKPLTLEKLQMVSYREYIFQGLLLPCQLGAITQSKERLVKIDRAVELLTNNDVIPVDLQSEIQKMLSEHTHLDPQDGGSAPGHSSAAPSNSAGKRKNTEAPSSPPPAKALKLGDTEGKPLDQLALEEFLAQRNNLVKVRIFASVKMQLECELAQRPCSCSELTSYLHGPHQLSDHSITAHDRKIQKMVQARDDCPFLKRGTHSIFGELDSVERGRPGVEIVHLNDGKDSVSLSDLGKVTCVFTCDLDQWASIRGKVENPWDMRRRFELKYPNRKFKISQEIRYGAVIKFATPIQQAIAKSSLGPGWSLLPGGSFFEVETTSYFKSISDGWDDFDRFLTESKVKQNSV